MPEGESFEEFEARVQSQLQQQLHAYKHRFESKLTALGLVADSSPPASRRLRHMQWLIWTLVDGLTSGQIAEKLSKMVGRNHEDVTDRAVRKEVRRLTEALQLTGPPEGAVHAGSEPPAAPPVRFR